MSVLGVWGGFDLRMYTPTGKRIADLLAELIRLDRFDLSD
jgi:hypothetical protein